MKASRSIRLMKVLLKTPNIYACEEQRELALRNLKKKMRRRDLKIVKSTQTKLFPDDAH